MSIPLGHAAKENDPVVGAIHESPLQPSFELIDRALQMHYPLILVENDD